MPLQTWRVRHAAHVGKCLVKFDMRGRIGRRTQVALDDLAVQIHDHHILRLHLVILDAGGLDDDEPRRPVDLRDVAPCEQNQLVFDKIEVCLQNLLFQCFQHIFHSSRFQYLSERVASRTMGSPAT